MFVKLSALWFCSLQKLLVKTKKIVLVKTCFQRDFEFFKKFSFIRKKVGHQKLKAAQKMQKAWHTRSSFW